MTSGTPTPHPEGASKEGGLSEAACVAIPLDVARWVYAAFLPFNPNKLRSKRPEVVAAAKAFKAAVEAHGDPRASLAQGDRR